MKPKRKKNGKVSSSLAKLLRTREAGVLIAGIAITFVLMVATQNRILSVGNIFMILRLAGFFGIVAVPVAVLLISGEFDLSVGSMSVLIPVMAGWFARDLGINIWLAAPISIAFAVLLGLINMIVTIKIGVPALITTLGTLILYRSLAYVVMKGRYIALPPSPIFRTLFGGGLWGIIPMVFIWCVAITVCFWILLEHTAYGNRVFATGGNKEAARILGVNTDRVKGINFILVAVFTGFASLCQFAFQRSINPMTGDTLPLDAIVAVVIGGTALHGGSGTVLGTLLGAFILAEVYTGLDVARVDAYWKPVFMGIILVVAVLLNTMVRKKKA